MILSSVFFNNCSNNSKPCKSFEIGKLEAICKVWGTLKYFHPGVGTGKIDWDEVIIETLKSADTINNKRQLNQLFIELIKSNYDTNFCIVDSHAQTGNIVKQYGLSWLNDTTFISNQNIKQLHRLIKEKRNYCNYYVSQDPEVGNLYFNNEKAYSDSILPSKNLRLLALFRYWNVINYFYPFHDINNLSWDSCLIQYIPLFIDIKDTVEYHLLVQELSSRLNDGHIWTESSITNIYWGIYSPPYKVSCIENKPIISDYFSDSLAGLYDIKLGDQIIALNEIPIQEIIKERRQYYSFSNKGHFNRRILEEILISPQRDTMNIIIDRGGDTLSVDIALYFLYELYQIQDHEYRTQRADIKLNDSTGYLNLKYLEIDEIKDIMSEFLLLKNIIIDIRNYPNGVLYELSKYLNPTPTNFVRIFYPNILRPGEFVWGDTLQTGIPNGNYFKGKIILLVNEQTQSHAEFTAMCFQSAPNVVTIGSTTAGTDGNVSYLTLPGGIITYYTGIGIEYPDGKMTQRVGIKIDIEAKPQIKDLYNGFDRILEEAINLE